MASIRRVLFCVVLALFFSCGSFTAVGQHIAAGEGVRPILMRELHWDGERLVPLPPRLYRCCRVSRLVYLAQERRWHQDARTGRLEWQIRYWIFCPDIGDAGEWRLLNHNEIWSFGNGAIVIRGGWQFQWEHLGPRGLPETIQQRNQGIRRFSERRLVTEILREYSVERALIRRGYSILHDGSIRDILFP